MIEGYGILFRKRDEYVYHFDIYKTTNGNSGILVGTALVNYSKKECMMETWITREDIITRLEEELLKEAERVESIFLTNYP